MPELDETPVEPVEAPGAAPDRRRLRTALRVSGRVLAGLIATGASVVAVGVVALVPLPTLGAVPAGIEVAPVPGDALRVCPGAVLRFGTETGDDAGTAFPVGTPAVVTGSLSGADPEADRLASAAEAASRQSPLVLRGDPGEEPAGAQSQTLNAPGHTGLAGFACVEPAGAAWLVGGAMSVGRTTLLSLVNPSEVDAVATVRIWGEEGPVAAPGMSAISIPSGAQRVVSLAAFAPGTASPVVEVTVRGGRIAAALQQSVVRGLTPGGIEFVSPGAEPAESLVIPGVRISASQAVATAESLDGWRDVEPAIRLLAPETPAEATVTVAPAAGQQGEPSSFVIELAPGVVTELPLTSGIQAEADATLPDGVYTITVESDAPVTAGVRASTATAPVADPLSPIPPAPQSDLAWFAATPSLADEAVAAVAPGPSPVLGLANPGEEDAEVAIDGAGLGSPVLVPAGGSVAVPVPPEAVLRLSGTAGLHASLSYAGTALAAGVPVLPARPLADTVTIRL